MTPPIKLLYICGSGRSGSTVLDLLLGGLPGVCSLGELHYLPEVFARRATALCSCGMTLAQCKRWGVIFTEFAAPLDCRSEAPGSDPFLSPRRIGRELFEVFRYGATGHLPTPSQDDVDLQTRLLRRFAADCDCEWLSDSSKKPLRLLYLLGSRRFDIRIIHLVRDPRAVMLSKRRANTGRTVGALRATAGWIYQNLLAAALYRRFPPQHRIRLDYEQLARDPRGSLQAIADHFGIGVVVTEQQARTIVPSAMHLAAGNRLRLQESQRVELKSSLAGLTPIDRLLYALCTRPVRWALDRLP